MLSGYRGIICALGLALASPSYGQNGKPDQPPPLGNSNPQLERIASAVEKQPVATAPDRGCQPGHDDRRSDLCAQWKAANAAADGAIWTKWGVWIGIIGSSLLLWQIMLTRKAVEDTSEATEAMREANNIVREGRRPYIVFQDFEVADIVRDIGTMKNLAGVEFTFNFINAGESPAINISMQGSFVSTRYMPNIYDMPDFAEIPLSSGSATCGPGMPLKSRVPIYGQQASDFNSQVTRAWFWVRCRYQGIWSGDQWFETHVCKSIEVSGRGPHGVTYGSRIMGDRNKIT